MHKTSPVLKSAAYGFLLSLMPLPALAATHAFDEAKGALSVDYAKYLSKHDIVFNKPILDPKRALTVGNGRVGAMVWNAKGLNLQVTGVDASPQTCFSQGHVNLTTSPPMDSGNAVFQEALSLYDGIVTTQYDANRKVTIMGSPNSEVMGIHVEDSRTGVKSVTLDLNMWDPATQITSRGGFNSMQADIPDMTPWKTVTAFSEATVAGINRGQADATNFGYTLAATVEGTAFTTQQVDSRTVRLLIAPAPAYTIWIACASRQNAAGNNSVAAAKTLLSTVKAAGYGPTLALYKNWWHDFWGKSFVQYSNASGDADYMENFYYLSTFIIASGGYGKFPFHFINGVYRSNADLDIHWSGAYWYWNMRDIYNSMLTSNHPEVMDGLYRLYTANQAKLKSFTQTSYSIDGVWVPETMRWDGDASSTTGSDYTKLIWTTGAEVSSNMYMRCAYTNDSAYLKATAYPFMRESAKFLQGKLAFDAGAKQYFMPLSNAHETYWKVKNSIVDLAAVRSLFPQAIQVAKALDVDPDLRVKWQNILDSLVPYKTEPNNGGTRYVAYDPPAVAQTNGENITSELAWPYGVTGIGTADQATSVNSFKSRPSAYSNVWSPDAIQAARLGLGDDAYDGMKLMMGKYQSYPNGFTNNDNGIFEFIGVHILAMNESLLQSHNDTLRVFPAMSSNASTVGRFTLAARGGFLVSSEKEGGEIKYVGIKSLYGKRATLANPWGTQAVQIHNLSNGIELPGGALATLSFNTQSGNVYLVERTGKPLSGYTLAQLTGTANYSAKTMAYNSTTLTLGDGAGKAGVGIPLRAAQAGFRTKTLLVSGNRFFLGMGGGAKAYTVAVHGLDGKLVREVTLGREWADMRADLGVPEGVYIVRVSATDPARP